MINYTDVVTRIDPHVRALLREAEAVWNELATAARGDAPTDVARRPRTDLGWAERDELHGQTDIWPGKDGKKDVTEFERFRVFERSDGRRMGLGYAMATEEREGVAVFLMRPNGSKRLIVWFQATDDSKDTSKMFAPIKGKGGGRSYFRGFEQLPPHYDAWEIAQMREVAPKHRLREIKVLLADKDDWQTMVEHGSTQIDIRDLT